MRDRVTSPSLVLCSQQRRKVTISLAEEVRKRHGSVGHAVVGFHVSKNKSVGPATRLMYMTEAIGVYSLINNRELKPAHPVTIVVADEVHERTMYTQMIIGLARTQMMENHTMILILMSATVDVAELKEAIPGAQDIDIDQHEYKVSRFFLQRDITKLTNVLELTARLIVTMHHERSDQDLVDGVPEGQHCDHFPCVLSRKATEQSSVKLADQVAGVGIHAWPGSGTHVQRRKSRDMVVL